MICYLFHFLMQSLDDITALYKKQAATAPTELPVVLAQSIIVDVIDYFYQRARRDNSNDNNQTMNNDEAGCSVPFSNNVGAENDNAYDNVHFCDDRFDDVARDADSPVQASQENIRDAPVSSPVVEAARVG